MLGRYGHPGQAPGPGLRPAPSLKTGSTEPEAFGEYEVDFCTGVGSRR